MAQEEIIGLEDVKEEGLVLSSQDGQQFPVPREVAMMSELVKTMWEGDKQEKEIPLQNVKGATLKKVIEYMQYHHKNPAKDIEKPLKSANMKEVVSVWDAEFVQVDQEALFELILSANYMD